MTTIKIGDWIKKSTWSSDNYYELVAIVDGLYHLRSRNHHDKMHKYPIDNDWVVKTTPTEEAVRLLTEAGFLVASPSEAKDKALVLLKTEGYTITPPPPKMTGMVHLYKHLITNYVNSLSDSELGGRDSCDAGTLGYKWIASVPWTEGQGLDRVTEGDELVDYDSHPGSTTGVNAG